MRLEHLITRRRLADCRLGRGRGGFLWALALIFLLFSRPVVAGAPAGTVAALVQKGDEQQQAVQALEQKLSLARALQTVQEKRGALAAVEIERLKGQPQGVARDLALGERLAQAQAQATELAQAEQARQRLLRDLSATRRQLLATCDRLLDADQAPNSDSRLSPAQRMSWLRLRTAQVEALLGDNNADKARALAQSELSSGGDNDEPQALRERADLLRDSADKLRREVARLQARSEELSRRLRMRERANHVDEDLFAEQSTARRGSSHSLAGSVADAPRDNAAGPQNPAPSAGSGTFSQPVPQASSAPPASTLDALLRVEGPGDPTLKLQALSRAQGELQTLASDLLRRASRLDQRAAELGRQK